MKTVEKKTRNKNTGPLLDQHGFFTLSRLSKITFFISLDLSTKNKKQQLFIFFVTKVWQDVTPGCGGIAKPPHPVVVVAADADATATVADQLRTMLLILYHL